MSGQNFAKSTQGKLAWVTPKISSMDVELTEGRDHHDWSGDDHCDKDSWHPCLS